jgi:hypothetical protein
MLESPSRSPMNRRWPARLQMCADTTVSAECDIGRTQGHVGGKTLNGNDRKRKNCLLLLLFFIHVFLGDFTFHWMNVSRLFLSLCMFASFCFEVFRLVLGFLFFIFYFSPFLFTFPISFQPHRPLRVYHTPFLCSSSGDPIHY